MDYIKPIDAIMMGENRFIKEYGDTKETKTYHRMISYLEYGLGVLALIVYMMW